MSNFSDHIPEEVIQHPATSKLLSVLDEVNNWKQEEIIPYIRSWNPILSTNTGWMLKQLGDYGFTDMPNNLPLAIIQQVLSNVDTICGTRGSKIGLQLFLSVFSLGEVTVDDSGMFVADDVLLLDHVNNGKLTASNDQNHYYLVNDTDQINKSSTLEITIRTKYMNGNYPAEINAIQSYLSYETISRQLPFSAEREIDVHFFTRSEFYYHPLLNKHFV